MIVVGAFSAFTIGFKYLRLVVTNILNATQKIIRVRIIVIFAFLAFTIDQQDFTRLTSISDTNCRGIPNSIKLIRIRILLACITFPTYQQNLIRIITFILQTFACLLISVIVILTLQAITIYTQNSIHG